MFMYLADMKYAETGCYPRRRIDVADAYESTEMTNLAETIVSIDLTGKGELVDAAGVASDILDGCLRG